MPRRVFCCFAAGVLLTGCAFFPRHDAAERPARHYHGKVLDANTGAPVAHAVVTAEYHYFGTTYVLPEEYLGFTLSQEDGSFDLDIPASKKPANHLEAQADVPQVGSTPAHHGQITGYNGVLNHVSTRRANTILVR